MSLKFLIPLIYAALILCCCWAGARSRRPWPALEVIIEAGRMPVGPRVVLIDIDRDSLETIQDKLCAYEERS